MATIKHCNEAAAMHLSWTVKFPNITSIPTTKIWKNKELHPPNVAMVAIACTTGKIIRLPLLQHKLEPFAGSLCLIRNLHTSCQITVYKTPHVW